MSSVHVTWECRTGHGSRGWLEPRSEKAESDFLELLRRMPAMLSIRLTVLNEECHFEKKDGIWALVEPKLPY